MAFVPLVLWTIANPALAVGMAVLAGGAYALGRIGIRGVHRRLRAWRTVRVPRIDRRART